MHPSGSEAQGHGLCLKVREVEGRTPRSSGYEVPGVSELSSGGKIMLSVSNHAESRGLLKCSQKAGEYLGIWVWSLWEHSSVT